MTDNLFQKTEGGVAAHHPARETLSIFVGPSTSDELNTIKPGLAPVACLRVDDIRFEFDSSFIGAKATEELKLLAQLRKDSPGILASVFGHADPVGDDNYNKQLSGRRSAAVYALLIRKVEIWEDIYSQTGKFTNPAVGDKWGLHAVQLMLTALGFYTGPITGKMDGPTKTAVEDFQGSPAGAGLKPDGDPGEKTRAKLFKAYMDAICVDAAGTAFQMDKTEFLAAGADAGGKGDFQGCSEFNPVLLFSKAENAAFQPQSTHDERDQENQPNRRVLIFFFKPSSKLAPAKWPCPRVKEGVTGCHARFFSDGEKRRSFQELRREYKDKKDTFACRFYDRLAVESPCEIGPSPLVVNALKVHLKLVWKDPDPAAPVHIFPLDFPVTVVFGDGTTTDLKVAADGKLEFDVERSKRSFTLNFNFPAAQYIATATAASKDKEPEKFVPESAVKSMVDDQRRVFRLPLNSGRKWEIADWDWKADGIGTIGGVSIFSNNEFNHLEDVSVEVGLETAPVIMTLDPHWQYLRFEYFDRFFGHANHASKQIGIQPLVIEGFRQAPASGTPPPDTRSNWIVNEADDATRCQCLPWILRRKADKTPDAVPDANVLVQFRTAPGTFIQCTDPTTRSVVTAGTPPASTDPGLNAGTATNVNLNQPKPDRLKFYDLPPLWQSTKYFARPPAAAPGNFFEKLTVEIPASANNDPTKMLTFSLDDIVLCRLNGGAIQPLALNANDRFAIFSHLFNVDPANPKVSTLGIYDPDPQLPFFSRNVAQLPATNYINDYPNWTRLVIARGNLFDNFDRRTPLAANQTVGARAAVMWVDATVAPNFVAIPNPMAPRPNPIRQNPVGQFFFVLQPFFEQRNRRGTHVSPEQEEGVGRFDMALIRCCDEDAGKEVAIAMNYFRFTFNFTPTPPAGSGLVASNLAGAAAAAFSTNALINLMQRWNGPDPASGNPYPLCNPARAQIEPKVATPALRVEVMRFAQAFPTQAIAHFSMNIFQQCRAFMGSFDGSGQLSANDIAPYSATNPAPAGSGFPNGTFITAHECGHGGGLSDEYVENAFSASYFQDGFYHNTPGSPYSPDTDMLMCNNARTITPRYFWHIAEWVRFLQNNDADYHVLHAGFDYELPHIPTAPFTLGPANAAARPFDYTHYHWPMKESLNLAQSTRGLFDAFLYPLGQEVYTTNVIAPGKTVAGILTILVKIRFTFHFATHADIISAVSKINANILQTFNVTNRMQVVGNIGGITFVKDTKACFLRFIPRFLVDTFSGNANYALAMGIANTAAAYQGRVNSIDTAGRHPRHFQVNTKATGANAWTATHNLSFTVPLPVPPIIAFQQFFADMIGVNPTQINNPNSYAPLVQQVIPGATVFSL